MITFSPLRTRRLDVRLKELTIGDEIALCNLPEGAHEKSMSEFLSFAVDSASAPSSRHIADPRAWSFGERALALSHYCSHSREDGPNYAITEVSKLLEYVDISKDIPQEPARFSVGDDQWVLRPLTGAALETIEALQYDSTLPARMHWYMGAMAAQLLRDGEIHPDPIADFSGYSDWLKQRMEVIKSYPASDFDMLFTEYRKALDRDTQFFRYWFDDSGVVILPKEAGADTPPARFLVIACIGAITLSVTGKA